MITPAVWAGVVVIGGCGAVLRFVVDRTVSRHHVGSFPLGTLVVNISGRCSLGIIGGLALSAHVALLTGTAFVGSYTTFSTWMLETHRLGEERQIVAAFANIVVSLGLGLAAAWFGHWVGARMTDDLQLTAYFAERQRFERRFLVDALLDLYGRSAVARTVVVRGLAGFGPHHELRSDQSLSMSEDPPVTVVAVDTAEKMTALADRTAAMTHHGLVTVGRVAGAGSPTEDAEVTVYLGRQDRVAGRPAHEAACETFFRLGFAGATAWLGVDGITRGTRRRARFFSRNLDVPVMITATGTGAQAIDVVPRLRAALEDPLITVAGAQLCKRDGQLLRRPPALSAIDDNGVARWQKLTVHTSESALFGEVPIHRAIVRRLAESSAVNGATVPRGLWGFQGGQKPNGDRLFQLTRRVPVTTIVIDTPERIATAFDVVDEMTAHHGLVVSAAVPALVSIDNGRRRGGTGLAQQ